MPMPMIREACDIVTQCQFFTLSNSLVIFRQLLISLILWYLNGSGSLSSGQIGPASFVALGSVYADVQ
jgi:hypothetical protein